jgi:formate dehydrogenase major subunit
MCLFQGCNEMGIWEMGCSADRLPGEISTLDSDASVAIQEVWGHNMSVDSGLNTIEMLHALDKQELKAILLLGVDPLAVFPNMDRTHKALSNAELFVRVGLFPALTEELAHVVFPATSIPEQDGTYINTEGRVQRVEPVWPTLGCAQSISRFLLDVASHLQSQWDYSGFETVFQEICSICSGWEQLTWDNVSDPGGVKLPYPRNGLSSQVGSKKSRMVPYTLPQSLLTADSVPSKRTPEGKWRAFPEEQVVYPGDATVSRHSRRLSAFMPKQVVRIHPQDAEKMCVREGVRVLLSSDVGQVVARIAFDTEVPFSGVVLPMGGPDLILSRLLDWPEEGFGPGWDTLLVSIKPLEEE